MDGNGNWQVSFSYFITAGGRLRVMAMDWHWIDGMERDGVVTCRENNGKLKEFHVNCGRSRGGRMEKSGWMMTKNR